MIVYILNLVEKEVIKMAKVYQCDVCENILDNPYTAKMKEFCLTVSNCDIYQVPEDTKIKRKIHLCGYCFSELKEYCKAKIRKEGD